MPASAAALDADDDPPTARTSLRPPLVIGVGLLLFGAALMLGRAAPEGRPFFARRPESAADTA